MNHITETEFQNTMENKQFIGIYQHKNNYIVCQFNIHPETHIFPISNTFQFIKPALNYLNEYSSQYYKNTKFIVTSHFTNI